MHDNCTDSELELDEGPQEAGVTYYNPNSECILGTPQEITTCDDSHHSKMDTHDRLFPTAVENRGKAATSDFLRGDRSRPQDWALAAVTALDALALRCTDWLTGSPRCICRPSPTGHRCIGSGPGLGALSDVLH